MKANAHASESEAAVAPLANAGTQEAPFVLHTHLTAGQKIRHGCHHFSAAMRA